MDMACVNKCVKGGKTRSACMTECYPKGEKKQSGKKKGASKKAPPFKKGGSY